MPAPFAPAQLPAMGKALLATVLWGCSFIAVRIALDAATPAGLVWMRNALAALLLFGLLRLRGGAFLPQPGDRLRVAGLGLLMGLHYLLQAEAMRHTSAMQAGWIMAFIPAVVAVGAWLFQGQRMRAIGWLGIAAASVGVFVLTTADPAQLTDAGLGDGLLFLSTFTWATYILLSGAPARRSGALCIAAGVTATSVLPTALLALVQGSWYAAPTTPTVAALVFLGAGAGAIALWAFTTAIAELGPERSAAFQYLQPFVTLVAAFVILSEPIGRAQLIGGPVVLLGVWLVQRGKRAVAK